MYEILSSNPRCVNSNKNEKIVIDNKSKGKGKMENTNASIHNELNLFVCSNTL